MSNKTSNRIAPIAKSGRRANPPRFKKKDWSFMGTGFVMPDRNFRNVKLTNTKQEIEEGLKRIAALPMGSDPFLKARLITHLKLGIIGNDLG